MSRARYCTYAKVAGDFLIGKKDKMFAHTVVGHDCDPGSANCP